MSLLEWENLVRFVNGRVPAFGSPGNRDPEFPCTEFDGKGYDGYGRCLSDGHYMCVECSHLSPKAPRFEETREGRGDRLRLYWARRRGDVAQ